MLCCSRNGSHGVSHSVPQGAPSVAQKILAFQQAFWKFLRPHTIRGTILGSCAVTAKAVLENPQASVALFNEDLLAIQQAHILMSSFFGVTRVEDIHHT